MLGRILLVALGACATETRTAMPSDASTAYSRAQLMTNARASCQAYGIAPHTEKYERCVRNEHAYRVAS